MAVMNPDIRDALDLLAKAGACFPDSIAALRGAEVIAEALKRAGARRAQNDVPHDQRHQDHDPPAHDQLHQVQLHHVPDDEHPPLVPELNPQRQREVG